MEAELSWELGNRVKDVKNSHFQDIIGYFSRILSDLGVNFCADPQTLREKLRESPKSYVDVPAGRRKSDFLYTNFLPNFPPICRLYHFRKKSTQLTKLGALTILPKIHPIYVILAPSSLMEPPPPIAIPNFAKRQAHNNVYVCCHEGKVRQRPNGA